MKIVAVSDLHADGGWRDFSFCKITTDDPSIVGWSEYMEGSVCPSGLSAIVRSMGDSLVGEDPRAVERLSQRLRGTTNQVVGGLANMAIAAIENALIDIKAKALGIPASELFGGTRAPSAPSAPSSAAPPCPALRQSD